MQHTLQTSLKHSPLWRLLCNLRIRQLLLMVLGLLCLIVISSLGWNAIQALNQYDKAEQMSGTNIIGQQTLILNTLLARERGLTAALLVNPENYNSKTRQHVLRLRLDTDQTLQQLYQEVEEHLKLPDSASIHQRLETMSRRLTLNRQQADQSLEDGVDTLTFSDWMSTITQRIEEVAMIHRIVMIAIEEVEHASHPSHTSNYGLFLKEAFFDFSENAGRERALISAVIAQQRPFRKEEYLLLHNYEGINKLVSKRLRTVVDLFPQTPLITQAQAELNTIYHQRYQALRSTVLQQSRSGQPYSVNTIEWFEQATEAVNAIINFSHAVNQHLNDDIDLIKRRARNTVATLFITLVLVVIVFIFAFALTYRRILMPLRLMESSANTIATGDFTQPIQILANDEFGEVGNALELMRNYLLNDHERRQHAENELRKLSAAIEQSVSSIVVTDVNGITEYVNPQFHQTTGYSADEVVGHKFNILASGETPHATYSELWDSIKKGRVWQGEILNRKKNGELYWDLLAISPVRDRHGEISHFISVQHDITERKEMEQQLNFMAYHDELTELPNRALLTDRFEHLANLAHRNDNKIALLILDLDRFKLINDSLGHRIGDLLLIEIAKRLKKIARASDTIARYGGDEFVILVNDFSSTEVLIGIIKLLVALITEPVTIEGHTLHTSTSIGISIWPDDGQDMETLLRLSDIAMYRAKEMGGDRFQFFTHELNLQTIQRLKLENALREAIQYNQFELYYQPQVNLATGRIIGAEALIRWNHPELGLVSPLDFIPLAEETNLILPIGEWVLKTACTQAVNWKQHLNPEFLMAVNVSALQLDDEEFINRVTTILEKSGLPPENLEIEITESSLMHQPEKMINVLNVIKSLGIKLAMDDFGTGYSSLSYLRRFPFDKLKIDRAFIKEITQNPEDNAITHAISEMAHSLNMIVIAEGVETESQMNYLKHSACDEIQGYLISKPLPTEEFELLLQQNTPHIKHLDESTL